MDRFFVFILAALATAYGDGNTNGFFKFDNTEEIVVESVDSTATFNIERTGGTTGTVLLTCEIINSTASSDVYGLSQTVRFADGQTSLRPACTFRIIDDNTPEANESFVVKLKILSGGGEVKSPSQAQLTILANDDAHGIVGFLESGPVSVEEPNSPGAHTLIRVTRKTAAFGAVEVAWKISSGPNNGADDFDQTSGKVIFSDGQTNANLTLQVKPDDIAENAETFVITLESVTGGAKLDQDTVSVIILANDAAVRFPVHQYMVSENVTSLSVEVSRGLQGDGITEVGPIQEIATVSWSLQPGTAKPGQDYIDSRNTLTFGPGETKKSFTVTLRNDNIPEVAENFTILLSNGSQNVFIVPPGIAVVTISPNDDHQGVLSFSQFTQVIGEDGVNPMGMFFVNRSAGTFGDVTVSWQIHDDSGADLSSVFSQTGGVLSFFQGESLKSLNISVKSDLVPEEAREYYVQLSGVTGGARLDNTPSGHRAVFYVSDSDDVYGVVGFADDEEQKILLKNEPRQLEFKLNRTGGSVGVLSVNVNVLYFTPGSSIPSSDLSLTYQRSVTMTTGETSAQLVVTVSDDSFIKVGSIVKVELLGVNLTGGATSLVNRVPPQTPRLGIRSTLSINITVEDANGEVGFARAHQSVDVEEPTGASPQHVILTVMRSGTSQQPTIFWNMTSPSSTFLPSDVAAMSGTVTFLPGVDHANISIAILPDDIPEVDEEFTVNLVNITKPDRLQAGTKTAKVKITQNDNPGGTFEFHNDSSVVLQEQESFSFTIVRHGSALDSRFVFFNITPTDGNSIIGGTNLINFRANQRNQTVILFFEKDNVPELDEIFHLNLYSGGPSGQMGVIGSKWSIQITVAQNEDPHGVFSFTAADVVEQIDESKNQKEVARFEVKRQQGSYGAVKVLWNVTNVNGGSSDSDISPEQGELDFAEGDTSMFIEIESRPDSIPEKNESFILLLTNVTGGARLGAFTEASLVISKNDDPVFFSPPTHVNVSEGSYANLTIRRGGDGTSHVVVTYNIEEGTATASDVDYRVPVVQQVSFDPGVLERKLSIWVPDDSKPEGVESFIVRLTNTTGDTVLHGDTFVKVTIFASDGGTGVFQFEADSFNLTGNEGSAVKFRVERSLSQHGVVHLYWQLSSVSSNGAVSDLTPGNEFRHVRGFIEFLDQEASKDITVEPTSDGIAERNEEFKLRLVNATGIATGENGKIGNRSEALLVVQANDDPQGLLRFDSNSKDVLIPEDFNPGMQYTTVKNLTVLRAQGKWGQIQVCWEVFTASESVTLPSLYDLFLLGDAQPGVQSSPEKRRPNTATYVYCFNAANSESYVEVPVIPDVKSELTISMWLLPASDSFGYVIGSTSGAQINYAFALNTSGAMSLIKFTYLSNTTEFQLNQDVADGQWHFVVITLSDSTNEAKFYVDDQAPHLWKLPGLSLSDSGTITVGGLRSANFTGCIQDVRLYSGVLVQELITEIFQPTEKLTPINGYLTYGEGVDEQNITIRTIDDNIAEKKQTFSVLLFSPKGGAKVDDSNKESRLTVLKSDNANGLFEFESVDDLVIAENENISVEVKRSKGTVGQVTVKWRVYNGSVSAVEDFLQDSGAIVFEEGDTIKTLVVPVKDEMKPELAEKFVLELVSAHTDGAGSTPASTPASGASLRPGHTQIKVTIDESDFPYGLLQFMSSVPVGNGTIHPATKAFKVEIREEVGTLRLHVVRAQGTRGAITCEWKVEPGSAVPPADYVDNAGTLNFADGNQSAVIDIQITDDSRPELNKSFEVVLYSPSGKAELNAVAMSAEVVILPSDDAFGVVNFTQNSLIQTVTEDSGSSSTLTVQRTGGTLGPVTVYWRASGEDLQDLIDTNGTVTIATGMTTVQFAIRVTGDEIPELSESFIIELTAVSAGRLAPSGTRANLTVLSSDDPYGVFAFEPSSVRVSEHNVSVSLSVVRQRGTKGTVRINFTTSDSSSGRMAKPSADYISNSGSIVFSSGQTIVNITVLVLDDVIPETEESILVNLTSVELVGGPAVLPAPTNSPRLGSDHVARIVIEKNDDANGVVQLSASSVTVTEPNEGAIVNVTRTRGAFGTVTVFLEVTPSTANGSDYTILFRNVTLSEGQRVAAVPISILDDQVPEFAERFRIKLLSLGIQGGAVLGNPTECTVTIAENDYPYGLIGFDSSSLVKSVQEPSSQAIRVSLTVVRRFGRIGATKLHWEATMNGHLATNDTSPAQGDLVFATEDSTNTIEFDVLPDNEPEVREVVKFNLTAVTQGRGVIDSASRMASVTIEANDAPHGVIEFVHDKYDSREGSEARLSVNRMFGTAGDIRVLYSTQQSNGPRPATENEDYNKIVNSSIVIRDGDSSGQITIPIVDDPTPELDETFNVILEGVELVVGGSGLQPQLGGVRSAVVTILKNDDAHGLFVIRARDGGDNGTSGSRITVPEPDGVVGVPVYFTLERQGGTEGDVHVQLKVLSVTADTGNDFSGLDGTIYQFKNGTNTSVMDINAIIKGDDTPERNEEFIVKLVNPTGGARVAAGLGNNVTVIIEANDGVAGRVGFWDQSRSVVVSEGHLLRLTVTRTPPAAGRVTVDWQAEGINASADFQPHSGTLLFQEGDTTMNITTTVQNDLIPEAREVFTFRLSNVRTFDVAAAGHASLISAQSTATVTVGGSDEPHGVVEFQVSSRDVTISEDENTTLTVARLFGMIGAIRVHYRLYSGSLQSLSAEQRLALPGSDFIGGSGSVEIPGGVGVGQIPVWILNDHVPELEEVFLVNITRVELVNSSDAGNTVPRLGSNLVSQVVISANDETRGVLKFEKGSVYVDESIGVFNLTVLRSRGTFGAVTVNYFVGRAGTADGNDFNIPDNSGGESTLEFPEGEREHNITVLIENDAIAEDDETFDVILKSDTVRGGAALGSPSRVRVTIRASDNAHGAFSFSPSSVSRSIFEPGTGDDNEAEFSIDRSGASFGTVVVGWDVDNSSASEDLSPVRGNVSFIAGQTEGKFKIRALLDSTPEQAETFIIKLSIVSGGGILSAPSQAQLKVSENDSPYGELEIISSQTLTGSIDVEEDVNVVEATVKRRKGNYGRITVDYKTVAQTASAPSGNRVHFEALQKLKTAGAHSWHVFSAHGDLYVVLASTNMTGALPAGVGNSGVDGFYGSTLFRWQGVLVPVQGFSTDGAVQVDSANINNQVYLAVANHGSSGRYEVFSRVYTMDSSGQLSVVQNISTQGASAVKFFHPSGSVDWYLIVANQRKNAGQTRIQSKVYKWQGSRFTEVADSGIDLTRSASGLAAFEIGGSSMVAIAFYHDASTGLFNTKSPVYRWQGNKFALVQEIDTDGPVGVEHFVMSGVHYLVMVNSEGPAQVYTWTGGSFVRVQDLPTAGALSVKPYDLDDAVFLAAVEAGGILRVYSWNSVSAQFQLHKNTTVERATNAQPVVIADPVAGKTVFFAMAINGTGYSPLLRPAMLSPQADFVPRQGQLAFENGQTELKLDLTILPDDIPERDEQFVVVIFNATNKATVGAQNELTVNILSNDDAHGRIGFAASSQFKVQPEGSRDTEVTFEVIREFGAVGRAVAEWNVTGNVSERDVSPASGQIVFADGVTAVNISVTIHKDSTPELDKVAYIRLLRLTETGSPANPSRGAVLNTARLEATLVIPANDEPHGVIRWDKTLIISQDTGSKNVTLALTIMRQFGLIGAVVVSYQTVEAQNLSNLDDQTAQPGVDFQVKKSETVVPAGANSTQITADIIHDNDTEIKKIFLVNITGVKLQKGSETSWRVVDSPRIDPTAQVLEIVIAQTNQSVGELNFNVSSTLDPQSNAAVVQESQGLLQLGVTRTGSTLGEVGFRYVVRPVTSGPYAAADKSDYSPSEGHVTFRDGESFKELDINITNDQTPEVDEAFSVQMSRPLGGVKIGQHHSVMVVISGNDYPYGLFGFQVTSQQINQVQEGGTLLLEVHRAGGTFREVHVTWRVTRPPSPQIQKPDQQLEPMNGTLTFKPGDQTRYITLSAVDDAEPEGDQEFLCELSEVSSGAQLNDARSKATIVITANDKASGVLSIDLSTRNILAGEPHANYDGVFVVRFRRDIGTFREATLDWQITGSPDPASIFNITSGKVTFQDGVSSQSVAVMVTGDNTPEELAVYSLRITSVVNAEISQTAGAREAVVIVVASDNPYGVIEFLPPLAYNVTEEFGTVNLTVRRNKGIIGRLSVNYSVASSMATEGADYDVHGSVLEFADREDTKLISISIKPDVTPELTEVIGVKLVSVELVGIPPKNYSTVNGLQLNIPPVIGINSEANITILQNDDARGTIQFKQATIIARERDKKVDIELEREGGSIGAVDVMFRFQNNSAFSGLDFVIPDGPLTFANGQSTATLSVLIVDDQIPEHREQFVVQIKELSNGANIGARDAVTVTIETSDDPNGLFGFVNSSYRSLANPNVTTRLVFGVSRLGGAQGEVQVSWKVMKVHPPCQSPCRLSDDFSGPTSGTLTFGDGDQNTQSVTLRVEPYRDEEPEEMFVLTIYAVTGNASIDELQSNITVTVQKFGSPNGIFGFTSTSPVDVNEPDTGRVDTLSFTVQRSKGFQGVVKVTWKVTSVSGVGSSHDLTSTGDTLTFNPGETAHNVIVGVRGDDVPELSEVYTVEIVSVDGGAEIDNRARNVSFRIRANDDPRGVFKLKSGAQEIKADTSTTRNFEFTIQREMGTFGAVRVEYQITHSNWYPESGKREITVQDQQQELSKTIQLSSTAFLSPGSSFTLSLIAVRYVGDGDSSIPPKLSSSSTQETVPVPETAANAVFKFAASSNEVTVTNGNTDATLVVVRHGLFGKPTVRWQAGFEQETFPAGFSAGQISPSNGYLLFDDGVTRNKSFSVKALPLPVPNKKQVYAVYLHSATTPVIRSGANVTKGAAGTAVIEYSGVLVVAPDSQSLTVQEGGKVTVSVLRQFSSLGAVQVTYSAISNSYSFNMAEGEFKKSFEVSVPNDNKPEKDRIYYINITAVTGRHARLGRNVTAKVTVKDNDSPHGIFSFGVPRLSVSENTTNGGSRVLQMDVRRTGGTLGVVSVLVRTVGGGESWNTSSQSLKKALDNRDADANPSVGRDYSRLEQRLTFPNDVAIPPDGQVKQIQLDILDDSDPEPDELVFVELTGVTGGARLATDADGLQAWAVVTIVGNDLMNGEFGFIPGSQEVDIDEDGAGTVTLMVGRTGAKFGSVKVVWRVEELAMQKQVEESEGRLTFGAGVERVDLVITLLKDETPEFASSFHVKLVGIEDGTEARIDPQYSLAKVNMLPSDSPNGTVGFAEDALFTAVDVKTTEVELEIVRSKGTSTDVTVHFHTRDLPESFSMKPGVKTYRATSTQDYEKPSITSVRFPPGQTSRKIVITLTPQKDKTGSYPKAFEVILLNTTSGARITQSLNTSMVIISRDKETTKFLKLKALAIQTPLTDDEINKILLKLKDNIKTPLDDERLELTKQIIQVILNDKKNRPKAVKRKLQSFTRQTLMEMYDALLDERRVDTRGKSSLSKSFESFVFSLLYGLPCANNDAEALAGKHAAVQAFRRTRKHLNGLKIQSGGSSDYFQYPSDMYIAGISDLESTCQDVHLIFYNTFHWFNKEGQKPVINGTVLSSSTDASVTLKSPIKYRIYTSKKRVTPKGAECVFWDFKKFEWSTDGCTKKYDKKDYVECWCDHFSVYAAKGESDDRTGYQVYFFVACFVCLGAFALAVITHLACNLYNTFTAKLMIHLFFACMMALLMLVVAAYKSPDFVDKAVSCSILAIFIHYFFLSQFSWMFVQAWNLWRILVLNDEHTNRKYIFFFIMGWGLPIVVIAFYVIIMASVFQWEFTQMYADVHQNGEMCFIPNAYAMLATCLGPVLLILMGVAVVFTQAYQVTPQWRYYDDIYTGFYNIKEMRHVIVLFVAVTLLWLFAGLHLAFGNLWLLIVFSVLTILTGMYVFVFFFVLRNQVRGHCNQSYAIQGMPPPVHTHDDLFRDHPSSAEQSFSSLAKRKQRPSPETAFQSEWEDTDLGTTPRGSRKLLVNLDESGSVTGHVNEMYEPDDLDNTDFDDLIFALKTGGQVEPTRDEKDGDLDMDEGDEHFEMRRISIADTHL